MAANRPDLRKAQELLEQSDQARASGQPAVALALIDAAIAIDPHQAVSHCKRGLLLKGLRRWADALAAFDNGIALNPELAAAHMDRGNALQELGRLEESLASYDRALAISPELASAWCNRGTVLHRMQRLDDAIASYDRALALEPALDEARFNRSTTLADLGQTELALQGFEQILARYPSLAVAHWNEALCRLRLGDFARGLKKFEWRWRYGELGLRQRSYSAPVWLGQFSLRGKTLLLYPEQGHGDAIQFCRYAPLLRAQGARVVIECDAPLVPLLETLDGVDAVVPTGSVLPAFDFHTPLMSLPLAMDTRIESIPAGAPYLRAAAARMAAWRQRLDSLAGAIPPARTGSPTGVAKTMDVAPIPGRTAPASGRCRKIGLAWFGNPRHTNDFNRSIALSVLQPLAALDVELVSLQREIREADRDAAAALGLRDFASAINDFGDVAALVAQLDLVISVDSAPAHVAGALGLPVWILLPFAADWRWLQGRNDSPWYPTAQLFRQQRPGDWAPVIDRLCAQLRQETSGHGRSQAGIGIAGASA